MVDGAMPELFVEDHGQGVQLTQFKHHAADGDGVRLHFVPLFLQCRQLGFGFFEAVAQFGVSGTVGYSAGYSWQTVFNTFGALSIASGLFGMRTAVLLRIVLNVFGSAYTIICDKLFDRLFNLLSTMSRQNTMEVS